jgi:hypothetical protein
VKITNDDPIGISVLDAGPVADGEGYLTEVWAVQDHPVAEFQLELDAPAPAPVTVHLKLESGETGPFRGPFAPTLGTGTICSGDKCIDDLDVRGFSPVGGPYEYERDVVIKRGEVRAVVPVYIDGDHAPEADETFRVSIVDAGPLRILDGSAEATIMDDEPETWPKPTLTLSGDSVLCKASATTPGASGNRYSWIRDGRPVSTSTNFEQGAVQRSITADAGHTLQCAFEHGNSTGRWPKVYSDELMVPATGVVVLPASATFVPVPVTCEATSTCTATLRLFQAASGTTAVAASRSLLGARKVKIPAGKTVKVKVRLSKKGRALLRRKRRLSVTAELKLTADGRTTTSRRTYTIKRRRK